MLHYVLIVAIKSQATKFLSNFSTFFFFFFKKKFHFKLNILLLIIDFCVMRNKFASKQGAGAAQMKDRDHPDSSRRRLWTPPPR